MHRMSHNSHPYREYYPRSRKFDSLSKNHYSVVNSKSSKNRNVNNTNQVVLVAFLCGLAASQGVFYPHDSESQKDCPAGLFISYPTYIKDVKIEQLIKGTLSSNPTCEEISEKLYWVGVTRQLGDALDEVELKDRKSWDLAGVSQKIGDGQCATAITVDQLWTYYQQNCGPVINS